MLTKSSKYAIRALVYIQLRNWDSQRPGAEEIAREIEAPEAFLAKILQALTKHKLLDSMKGRGGGFFFTESKTSLNLYDVIHIIEGDACFNNCGFGLNNCNKDNPCPLHDKYLDVREMYHTITKTETIQSLAQKISEGNAVLNSDLTAS